MKYRLINFLICPECKSFPLKLTIFKDEYYKERIFRLKPCDLYCGYEENYINNIDKPPCEECIKHEIIDGYLFCEKCGEWYPIIDGIVIMHIGDLRPKNIIKKFVEKYKDKIPEDLIKKEFG